jgi:hypothetical protein
MTALIVYIVALKTDINILSESETVIKAPDNYKIQSKLTWD